MIIHSFDDRTPAIIDPVRKENAPMLDALIITFSYLIEEAVCAHFDCQKIAELHCACGVVPVYAIDRNGKKIGFFKTFVGAPVTVGLLEDTLREINVSKILMFGGCGCLDKNIAWGKIIIPSAAYRDEGTSYHYAPAADYIPLKNHAAVAQFMQKAGIPYVLGKTWTTDAIYRETRGNFEKRKADGCLAVEMEVAAVQAVCDFRGVAFYSFLKSGDLLDAPQWESSNEFGGSDVSKGQGSQHDPRYFLLALDLADFIS